VIGIQDRHAVDRACGIRAGDRVDDVVRADNECHVCVRKLGVDFLLVIDNVIGYAGFGQQHIHMAGHSSGDRVNRKLDVNATVFQQLSQFPHLVLRLRDGHAVTGDDQYLVRERHHDADVGCFDRFHAARNFTRFGLHVTESGKKNIGERAIHRFGH